MLEMEPRIKNNLMEKWHKISLEANKDVPKKFTKATDLIAYLKI